MLFDLALTAGGLLPFYLSLIAIMTREFEAKFLKLMLLFFVTGLTTIPFFALQYAGVDKEFISSLYGPVIAISVLAFTEELIKSVALFFDKELQKHYYYPILVGLSFAFFENVSYFLGFDFTLAFIMIALVRLFMVSTAHAVFTTLVAHFINKGTHRTKSLYYILGILIAGSFHSLFNLLNHWEMSYLVVPLLLVLIVYLHFDEPLEKASNATSAASALKLHPQAVRAGH